MSGVVDRRFNLAPMTDDAAVAEQASDVAGAEPCHAREVEIGKRPPERVALAKNRQPAQSRLKSFETDLLEQPVVSGDRASPFVVVVADIQRIGARPPAACHTIGITNETLLWHRVRRSAFDGCCALTAFGTSLRLRFPSAASG